jgi:xylan 1,4-beta-xylosidase
MKEARDTAYVGPALANTVRQCDGIVNMLSFWTFSDVFEEDGPIRRPFEGHFGLRAKGGINKPSFYAFSLLHRFGDRRLANRAPNILVTRRGDGPLVLAVWNLVDPDGIGSRVRLRLTFNNIPANASVAITRVDDDHGNTLAAYRALGSPDYPTQEQVREINAATALPAPERLQLDGSRLDLELQVNALALIEIPTTP